LPAGSFLAVVGILIALVLAIQPLATAGDRSKWLIVAAAMGGAVLNWVWARRADRGKV
jgi:hypothetical protein